jgi:DNA-3-methyladenine glycosylase II
MEYFEYGQAEIDHLKASDPKLGQLIDTIGIIKRQITPDPFEALISSVVSQQISNKAAETVWKRFLDLVGSITPENILRASQTVIQSCGMSHRKVSYIIGIAEAAKTGAVDFKNLASLSNETIIAQLTALNGVGVWTAEMLLIFSLKRPDILSYNDLGIRRGIMILHGLQELTKKQFEHYRQRYSPYGTIASFYLWELNNNNNN